MANRIQTRKNRQAQAYLDLKVENTKLKADLALALDGERTVKIALGIEREERAKAEESLKKADAALAELTREHTGKITVDENGAHFEIDGKPAGEVTP